jgi:hypothetical protein
MSVFSLPVIITISEFKRLFFGKIRFVGALTIKMTSFKIQMTSFKFKRLFLNLNKKRGPI